MPEVDAQQRHPGGPRQLGGPQDGAVAAEDEHDLGALGAPRPALDDPRPQVPGRSVAMTSAHSSSMARNRMPCLASCIATSAAVRRLVGRPACRTTSTSRVTTDPSRRRAASAASPTVAAVAAQAEEELDVARRAGQRARDRSGQPQAQLPRRRGDVAQRGEPQRRISHHAACPQPLLADLELRLHHRQQDAFRARGERGQHRAQRDERQVGDGELDRPTDLGGCERAHVGAVVHLDPRIAAQPPDELPVADVDRDDLRRSAVQQHVGEATGGCARIEAAQAARIDLQRIERADQLVGAARSPLPFGRATTVTGVSRSTTVAAFSA